MENHPTTTRKIRPLPTTQLMMTWLSMCPADESATRLQKRYYIACTSVAFITNALGFLTGVVYSIEYISIDFAGAAFAFMVAIGALWLFYFMIAAIRMRHQIGDIFAGLSTIYANNENEVTFQYLTQANDTSEWMWTLYFKYAKISVAGLISTSSLSVLYCYFIRGDSNADHFYRPSKLVLPWDQTTLTGYFGELLATAAAAYEYFMVNGSCLLLYISMCIHHRAFYKMFKHSIDESGRCDAQLLCDLIRFHLSAKDWFLASANVYKSFLLVQLICGAVWMTVSVFFLDLQWQHFGFTAVSVMISTSIGITTLFFYCYFGQLTTRSYEMMPDRLYDMNWYEQPNELQKYFTLMIRNMQKPLYYHGFEVARLDLQCFIKLLRSVLSYYLAMKTIATK